MLEARYNAEFGRVDVVGSALWSRAEIEQYLVDFRAAVTKARRIHGTLKMLSDMTGSAVQAPETAEFISSQIGDLFRAGDRLALVTTSALLRMQYRRQMNDEMARIFSTVADAEQWLAGC